MQLTFLKAVAQAGNASIVDSISRQQQHAEIHTAADDVQERMEAGEADNVAREVKIVDVIETRARCDGGVGGEEPLNI